MVTNIGHSEDTHNVIFGVELCGVKFQIPVFDVYLYNTHTYIKLLII
jgi:hypothetical protein